jgi:phosphatidate phosphatase PAH1
MPRSLRRLALFVLITSLLAACTSKNDTHGDLPPAGVDCASLTPTPAIVADIDGTLTLSDAEFLTQFVDPTYVPVPQPDAVTLIAELYDRGYMILYLTARPENLSLSDGTTVREATVAWLESEGFPLDPDRTEVVLAPDSTSGSDTTAYKLGSLQEHQAAGWEFDYAYGNATTDIDAYLQAGIPPADVYIVGANSGEQGTAPVTGDGWTDHLATVITPTGRICDF